MLCNYKILVLDDHAFQCAHVRHLLDEAGLKGADVAYNAQEALSMMTRTTYHIVIMDLKMPDMDGIQFIDEVAKAQMSPMLAITTSCSRRIMNSVSLMAKEKGLAVIGTFSKPFRMEYVQQLFLHLKKRREVTKVPSGIGLDVCALFDSDTLTQALNDGRIQAWFQPKKSLTTGHIVGAEALARWEHPEFGFMLPSSFLTNIRKHNLDHMLLMRMLKNAMTAYHEWSLLGYTIPVSINLATKLLNNPELPDELYHEVIKAGVPPGHICFELLEDETTSLPGQYYMGASRLRLKGFKLAQDDFGIGYSSMYSLISTPFTEMKIDRAFVSGATDDEVRAAALTMSVQLGRQLGLLITAEGVETTMELELLRRIGCDCVQGFLISAAIDRKSFSQLLIKEPRISNMFCHL